MKFLHLGDLHIGKILHGRSLIEDQAFMLKKVVEFIGDQNIELVIIAGDLYDRLIPTVEAVELLNDFLNLLINEKQVKVFIISGNHDSVERLNFASSILKSSGLIIESVVNKKMSSYCLEDQYGKIYFHLVPFFKPSKIRQLFNDDSLKTYEDAFKCFMEYNQDQLSNDARHVLVTHQFFVGFNQVVKSESETILSVGGSEMISSKIVESFDYVALGHLHAPQSVGIPTIRYSGSLLKYSFDEAKQSKSFCVVEMCEKGVVKIDLKTIKPLRDVRVLEGCLEDLLKVENDFKTDYVALLLKDQTMIINAMDKVRLVYPNALQITYEFYKDKIENQDSIDFIENRNMSEEELFIHFYHQVVGLELVDEKLELFKTLIEDFRKGVKS